MQENPIMRDDVPSNGFEYEDILGTKYHWMTERKCLRYITILDQFEQHYTGETLRWVRVEDQYGRASYELLADCEFNRRLTLRTD